VTADIFGYNVGRRQEERGSFLRLPLRNYAVAPQKFDKM